MRLVARNLTTHESLKLAAKGHRATASAQGLLANAFDRVLRRWRQPSFVEAALAQEQGNRVDAFASPKGRFEGHTCGEWRSTGLDLLRPGSHRGIQPERPAPLANGQSGPLKPRLISEPSRPHFRSGVASGPFAS